MHGAKARAERVAEGCGVWELRATSHDVGLYYVGLEPRGMPPLHARFVHQITQVLGGTFIPCTRYQVCLLYTSDAADE